MIEPTTNELGWMLDDVLKVPGGPPRDPALRRRHAAGPLRRASTATRPSGRRPALSGLQSISRSTAEFCGPTETPVAADPDRVRRRLRLPRRRRRGRLPRGLRRPSDVDMEAVTYRMHKLVDRLGKELTSPPRQDTGQHGHDAPPPARRDGTGAAVRRHRRPRPPDPQHPRPGDPGDRHHRPAAVRPQPRRSAASWSCAAAARCRSPRSPDICCCRSASPRCCSPTSSTAATSSPARPQSPRPNCPTTQTPPGGARWAPRPPLTTVYLRPTVQDGGQAAGRRPLRGRQDHVRRHALRDPAAAHRGDR